MCCFVLVVKLSRYVVEEHQKKVEKENAEAESFKKMAQSSGSASGARQTAGVEAKPKARPAKTIEKANSAWKSLLKTAPKGKQFDIRRLTSSSLHVFVCSRTHLRTVFVPFTLLWAPKFGCVSKLFSHLVRLQLWFLCSSGHGVSIALIIQKNLAHGISMNLKDL